MTQTGGCHCGAVRYEVAGPPQDVMLCHCRDCQKSAGAPAVAFAAFPEANLQVTQGVPIEFNSSGAAFRSFCGTCGSGLWYRNEEILPGIVEVHAATLDNADAFPANGHIQLAERIGWMATAHELPGYQRFPE